MRKQMIDFYNATVATPWVAAERGYIDAVIEPAHTRLEIRRAMQLLRDKKLQRTPASTTCCRSDPVVPDDGIGPRRDHVCSGDRYATPG